MPLSLLGVKINSLQIEGVLDKVKETLSFNGQQVIFSINPEILVKAQKDDYFHKVLNSGSLNVCDGRGVQFFVGNKAPRITGVDLMQEICEIAGLTGQKVYLLGSGNYDVVKKSAARLTKKISGLQIVGQNPGPKITELATLQTSHQDYSAIYKSGLDLSWNENKKILSEINRSRATILFVAFGMGKQEKWLYENLSHLPNIKIAMVVGGALDIISGRLKRAPLLFRQIGVEWLYRLWQEPKRLPRIYNATIKFVYYVFLKK